MRIADAISAFITADPQTSLTKRMAAVIVPGMTIGITAVLALTAVTAAGHGPLPQQLAETLLELGGDYARIDIQTAVYAGIGLYVLEKIMMWIMEKRMKPLIASGEARGEARAEARAREKFAAWKEDQRRRGVAFYDDEDQAEDTEEASAG